MNKVQRVDLRTPGRGWGYGMRAARDGILAGPALPEHRSSKMQLRYRGVYMATPWLERENCRS